MFDVRGIDLGVLNSLTKYPSIPTYHKIDPKDGSLWEELNVDFGEHMVLGTEKVDGVNARIIMLPDDTYILGSRKDLLYAQGDLIGDASLGIVASLRPVAEALPRVNDRVRVYYVELFGGKEHSGAGRNYGGSWQPGWRLFDVLDLVEFDEQLGWSTEKCASWRDHGLQPFLNEYQLIEAAKDADLQMVPRLFMLSQSVALPTDHDGVLEYLTKILPSTQCRLDELAGGKAEGIVVRTPDRSLIAKLRFEDYRRTQRIRQAKARVQVLPDTPSVVRASVPRQRTGER